MHSKSGMPEKLLRHEVNYINNYLKQICNNDKVLYSTDKKNISIADNLWLYKSYETISIIVRL